jgi:long-chain acyl-CoA synthetase
VRACVVLRPDATAGEADLIAFARDHIAHYKCPRSVVFVEEIPRNPSGKILKTVLRERYG